MPSVNLATAPRNISILSTQRDEQVALPNITTDAMNVNHALKQPRPGLVARHRPLVIALGSPSAFYAPYTIFQNDLKTSEEKHLNAATCTLYVFQAITSCLALYAVYENTQKTNQVYSKSLPRKTDASDRSHVRIKIGEYADAASSWMHSANKKIGHFASVAADSTTGKLIDWNSPVNRTWAQYAFIGAGFLVILAPVGIAGKDIINAGIQADKSNSSSVKAEYASIILTLLPQAVMAKIGLLSAASKVIPKNTNKDPEEEVGINLGSTLNRNEENDHLENHANSDTNGETESDITNAEYFSSFGNINETTSNSAPKIDLDLGSHGRNSWGTFLNSGNPFSLSDDPEMGLHFHNVVTTDPCIQGPS